MIFKSSSVTVPLGMLYFFLWGEGQWSAEM